MEKGRFGIHGGQYIPETLMNEIIHLEEQYEFYKNDPEFCAELDDLLKNYAGRPSLLYYAEKMTKDLGGAKIYLKREDLNHTGSHKINNVLGQVLMAKKMGKTRVIAETGAGQHGVACARRCVSGQTAYRTPTMYWALSWDRIRFRRSCGISRLSSDGRQRHRFWKRKESFRQLFWRVSAAAAMQWGCSMSLFRKRKLH